MIEQGVPLTGYFRWSLMDIFEWARGTRERFGFIHGDLETQKRIVKASGKWFSRVTSVNAVVDQATPLRRGSQSCSVWIHPK